MGANMTTLVARRAQRGQVHVFGQRLARKKRFPAEEWTSPQLARERLLLTKTERIELRVPQLESQTNRFAFECFQ